MEYVNEYIYFKVEPTTKVDGSYCEITEYDTNIGLSFGLYAKDCLFDLSNNNYFIYINISKLYFEKYNETFDIVAQKQTICCNTQSKLLEIVNCSLVGLNKKIFLESSILFLLYQAQKNSLISQIGCNTCAVISKPTDTDKMLAAKNYIISNLDRPLTIPLISAEVGTNQCYLKKGFKEIYNQTIFEFIQENRMIKAKYMLEKSQQNITEVAFNVGYSSLSSFSQAYKNYFGVSPAEHIKQNIPNN